MMGFGGARDMFSPRQLEQVSPRVGGWAVCSGTPFAYHTNQWI